MLKRIFGLVGKTMKNPVLWVIVIGVLFFLFQSNIKLVSGSDDTIFLDKAEHMHYLSFIKERYMTWSSRIGAETFIYFFVKMNLGIWKIFNVLAIFLFAYSANRIFKKKVNMVDFIFVLATFGLVGHRILTSSTFCFHGSFNYLWPAATGLFALIPLADIFLRSENTIDLRKKISYIMAISYTVLANEQMGLIVLAFYGLYIAFALIRKIKIQKDLYFYLLYIFILLLFVLLAPGNSVRYHAEIGRWYPDFNQIPFVTHMRLNIIWFFSKFFSEQRYLVILLGGFVSYFYFLKTSKRNYLLEFMVALPASMLFIKGIKDINGYLFAFDGDYSIKIPLSFAFWSLYLMVLFYSLVKIDKTKVLNALIVLAGISTLLLMWLSPTIYASKNRVILICSLLLVVLINKLRIDFNLNVKPFLLIYTIAPIINLLILFSIWSNKFTIYY